MKRILGAALLYPLVFAFGCSNSAGGSAPDPNNPNGDGGGNNAGTGSTSVNNGGSGFHPQGGSGNSGTNVDIDSGCASQTQPAALTQVNILFLLDKSGSMGDQKNSDGTYSWQNAAIRWNPVVTTLDSFFTDQKSTGIYASLSFLPADGDITTACKVTSYSAGTNSIKVPLTLLDATGRQTFLKRLCDPAGPQTSPCIVPAGGTPTRPALQGTIDYMKTVQTKYPDSKTVIVFITDGEPGFGYQSTTTSPVVGLYSCDDLSNTACMAAPGNIPPCSAAQAEVDAVANLIQTGAPAKSIYLVGVGDLSQATMDEWGTASGNPALSLLNVTDPNQAATLLKTALENIRSTHLDCNIKMPLPQAGGAIDINKVNVNYIDGTGKATNLGRSDDCSSSKPSWKYDNPGTPTKIVLCSSACTMAQQDAAGRVEVVLGCATIIN